jgi:hypothetical protein
MLPAAGSAESIDLYTKRGVRSDRALLNLDLLSLRGIMLYKYHMVGLLLSFLGEA